MGGHGARLPVNIRAEQGRFQGVQTLGQQSSHQSCQHIPGTAPGQGVVPGGIDEHPTVGRPDQRGGSLEHQHDVPPGRQFPGQLETAALGFFAAQPRQTRQFSRMGCQDHLVRAEGRLGAGPGKGVQGIGVHHQGQRHLPQHVDDPAISGGIGSQARPHGQSPLILKHAVQHRGGQGSNGPGGGFGHGPRHRFGQTAPHGRLQAQGDRHRHQARAGTQGPEACQMGSAAIIP